jgi:hypothetical protein
VAVVENFKLHRLRPSTALSTRNANRVPQKVVRDFVATLLLGLDLFTGFLAAQQPLDPRPAALAIHRGKGRCVRRAWRAVG